MQDQLFKRYREAIADLHDEAEKNSPLHKIVTGEIGSETYHLVLQKLYGFLSQLEPLAIAKIAEQFTEEERIKLARLPSLKRDLDHFGIETTTIPKAPINMDLSSPARALGWLYLSEGSRLGGQVLSTALKKHFDLQADTGAAYFSSGGESLHSIQDQWNWFKGNVTQILSTEELQQESIDTARQCFAELNQWLEE